MLNFDNLTVQKFPWPHVVQHNSISKTLCEKFTQFVKEYDIEKIPTHDKLNDIITWPVSIQEATNIDQNLKILYDSQFHKKIFSFWNVETPIGYTFSVNWDWCNEKGSNGFHCDLGNTENTCDVITLQWYMKQDNDARTLILQNNFDNSIVDTLTKTKSFVMFKSTPQTFHKFDPGLGERISLRLRLKTNLINSTHIHHYNQTDSIGVIIDCKNMECGKSIEHSLGNFTRLNLSYYGWNNIIVIDKNHEFDLAVSKLTSIGCKKIVVLFAGAIVGEYTKNKIKLLPEEIFAHKSDDRIFRKYIIFPTKNYISIQQKTNYGSNILNSVNNQHNHFLDIHYIHPEKNTVDFLDRIQKFMLPNKEGIPIIEAEVYSNLIDKIQKHQYFSDF